MTLAETLETIKRANPSADIPPPPPFAPLLERIDPAVRSLEARYPARRPGTAIDARRLPPRRVLVLAAPVLAVVAVAILLTGGPGGGRFDVAGAFYRATAPGSGVLHIVVETRTVLDGRSRSYRSEMFSAGHPRRARDILTFEGQVLESTVQPQGTLSWSAALPHVIRRSRPQGQAAVQTPVEWLRAAYREKRLRVIGRSRRNGRAVWRMSVLPAASLRKQRFHGHALPLPSVLIDAHSFVPLENVVYSVRTIRHRPELESTTSRYLSYEEFPVSGASEDLLKLAPHPKATFETFAGG